MDEWKCIVMKKYFKFKRLREVFKIALVELFILVVVQCCRWHMAVDEIIVTDFIIIVIYVFMSLVVDWALMKGDNSKNKDSRE